MECTGLLYGRRTSSSYSISELSGVSPLASLVGSGGTGTISCSRVGNGRGNDGELNTSSMSDDRRRAGVFGVAEWILRSGKAAGEKGGCGGGGREAMCWNGDEAEEDG